MRYVDLSYEGRQTAERSHQLNNGKLPHGGYKGSRRHPLSPVTFAKGVEFKHKLDQEVEKMVWEDELMMHGTSPSWSLLVHKEPSYTDESPLMVNNYLAGSKMEQKQGVDIPNRASVTGKCGKPIRNNGSIYYRPNSTHQFLSATDLRNCTEKEVNIQHGRPTRATLLRIMQRRDSASSIYNTRRDFLHRLHDIRNSSQLNLNTQSLKFETVPDKESLHSFLTGTRYNRYNPTLGCYFTELKSQESLQKSNYPEVLTPTPDTTKQRSLLVPHDRYRPTTVPVRKPNNVWRPQAQSASHYQTTFLKLKVIGNHLPVSHAKDSRAMLPTLHTSKNIPERHSTFALQDVYKTHSYSPAAPSVKSDSDIQDISESVKNAIIASSTELPAEGAGNTNSELKNSKTSIQHSEAESSVGEMSRISARISFVGAPAVVACSPCFHEENNEEAEETAVNKTANDQDILDNHDSSEKDIFEVHDDVLEENHVGSDDIETGDKETDEERSAESFISKEVMGEKRGEILAEIPLLNDHVQISKETLQDKTSTEKHDDNSKNNKDVSRDDVGEEEETVDVKEISDSEEDDIEDDGQQRYQAVRFFITEEDKPPGYVVQGNEHNQAEHVGRQET